MSFGGERKRERERKPSLDPCREGGDIFITRKHTFTELPFLLSQLLMSQQLKAQVSNTASVSKLLIQRSSAFESSENQNTDTTQRYFLVAFQKKFGISLWCKCNFHVVKTGGAVLQIHNMMVLEITSVF